MDVSGSVMTQHQQESSNVTLIFLRLNLCRCYCAQFVTVLLTVHLFRKIKKAKGFWDGKNILGTFCLCWAQTSPTLPLLVPTGSTAKHPQNKHLLLHVAGTKTSASLLETFAVETQNNSNNWGN